MARGSKRSKPRPWSMHSELHGSVLSLLNEDGLWLGFYGVDDDINTIRNYDTNVMGQFLCRNPNCYSNGWPSKKIAITIRLYEGQKYNARIYHQRCLGCHQIGKPILDSSYEERVTYWLKKWNGVKVKRPIFSGRSKGPHNKALCEGCKAGHCRELFGMCLKLVSMKRTLATFHSVFRARLTLGLD